MGCALQEFGRIQSCTVLRDHSGKSKQVGFVQFSSDEEATSCVEAMHGKVKLPAFKLTVPELFSISIMEFKGPSSLARRKLCMSFTACMSQLTRVSRMGPAHVN